MEINQNNAGWTLTDLTIRLEQWGEFKGKHVGKITFMNKASDAFTFNLSPEETQEYINLVAGRVVKSASHLGDKLLAQLNLLPEPRTIEVIENTATN